MALGQITIQVCNEQTEEAEFTKARSPHQLRHSSPARRQGNRGDWLICRATGNLRAVFEIATALKVNQSAAL
jgi:hypothetical protein